MAENKVPRISIAIPDDYRSHLADMAKEAGLTVGGVMSSMLLDVVDDDRQAHGLEKLSRSALNYKARK
jgi:hypothetical protein